MRLFDSLFGRTRLVQSNLDQLFGLSAAAISLQAQLNLTSTGAAALSFRPVSSGDFKQIESDMEGLLNVSKDDTQVTWRTFTDPYGYQWILLKAPDLENLAASVYTLSRELEDSGYGEQLLAAVFQFHDEHGTNVYWIYNFKRGTWYPFAPAGNQQRDNALELRLSAVMKPELKIETDMTRWFPLWGIPL